MLQNDLQGSRWVSQGDAIESKYLSALLANHQGQLPLALEIGKTPFTPTKPIHIFAFGKKAIHVSSVLFFDE